MDDKTQLMIYDQIMNYEKGLHEQNQKRIKGGLLCLWIIPAIFLFLLFITDSSKIIFLVLWIVSLFAICGYLIYVEYADFYLQETIQKLKGIEEVSHEGLIDLSLVEERVSQVMVKYEAKRDLAKDTTEDTEKDSGEENHE